VERLNYSDEKGGGVSVKLGKTNLLPSYSMLFATRPSGIHVLRTSSAPVKCINHDCAPRAEKTHHHTDVNVHVVTEIIHVIGLKFESMSFEDYTTEEHCLENSARAL
jgi:hypothetical protein